jgi:hypothetical protein
MNRFMENYGQFDSLAVLVFYIVCAMILSATILLIIILIKQKKDNKKSNDVVITNNIPTQNEIINSIPLEVIDSNLTEKVAEDSLSKTTRIDIDEIAKKMATDLEEKTVNYTDFEKEQEEKSIISYEELKKAATKEPLPNVINYKIDTNEEIKKEVVNDEPKRFVQSPMISPVYGINVKIEPKDQPKVVETESIPKPLPTTQLEKTLNIEPLNKEIKKNDEFLKALKDFRNNL